MVKNKSLFFQRFLITLIFIFGILTVGRSFFTIDITDESYPLAETLAVLKGNVPYAYCSTDVVGMTFYMIPFVVIYKFFVPSLTGLVLYMRLCFSIIRLLLVLVVFKLLRKKNDTISSLLSCLVLTVWYYHSNYFSYNSNSMWSLIIVSTWLYILYDAEFNRENRIKLFCAGVISALAVFSHPFAAEAIVVYVILLFIFSEKGTKFKRVIAYCLGGIFQSLFVLFCIVVQVGFSGFLNGVRNFMNVAKYCESFSKNEGLVAFLLLYKYLFIGILITFVIIIIITSLVAKKGNPMLALALALAFSSVYAFVYAIKQNFDLILVGAFVGSTVILLNVVLLCLKKRLEYLFFSLPFIIFVFLLLTMYRNNAVTMHPSLAVPAFLPIILTLCNEDNYCKIINGVATVLVSITLIISDSVFVYRDGPISNMNTVVCEGVYRGLRTTSKRAKCLVEMENYIDSITEDGKIIMFRDNVPFAYLMYKGQQCELQTWDILNYTGGWKLDRMMYNYFLLTDSYPDEIVYIDWGRDDCLSIETDYFRFNDWVNSYYDYSGEIILNSMFRIKEYNYNGKFGGDYSEWTDFIKW